MLLRFYGTGASEGYNERNEPGGGPNPLGEPTSSVTFGAEVVIGLTGGQPCDDLSGMLWNIGAVKAC